MASRILALVGAGVVMLCSVGYAGESQIDYTVMELGGGEWQYSYEVSNLSLSVPIEEFTIYFGYGLFENLVVSTPDPPASEWDELVLQPEPQIADDGVYDAKANAPDLAIDMGETVGGFSVSFDWLGAGEPGPQFYQIVDPDTFVTIDYGWTPEPATLFLLGAGGIVCLRKRSKHKILTGRLKR